MSALFEVGENIRGTEEKTVFASDQLWPSLGQLVAELGRLITPEQYLRGEYLHTHPYLEKKYLTGRLIVGDFFELRQPSPRIITLTILDGLETSQYERIGFKNRAHNLGDRRPYGSANLFLDGELLVTEMFNPEEFLNCSESMHRYSRHGLDDLSGWERTPFYDWESQILSGNMRMRIGHIMTTGAFDTGTVMTT